MCNSNTKGDNVIRTNIINLVLVVALVFAPGLAFGQSISLDYVDGLYGTSAYKIAIETPVTFHIRMTADVQYSGITNGFRVYSDDDVNWGAMTADTTGTIGKAQFDMVWIINYFGITGLDADTVGFGGSVMFGSGMIAGFDDITHTISIEPIAQEYVGSEICLDSCDYPPSGIWKWAPKAGGTVFPEWDGPHCYVIIDPTADSDEDGILDGDEFDTDYDGLSDGMEFYLGTQKIYGGGIMNPDSDYDGLLDGDEYYTIGTDPRNSDTDGDGFSDGIEIVVGTDPLVYTSTSQFNEALELIRGNNSLVIMQPRSDRKVYENTPVSVANLTNFQEVWYRSTNTNITGWSENTSLTYNPDKQLWQYTNATWAVGSNEMEVYGRDLNGTIHKAYVQFTAVSGMVPNYALIGGLAGGGSVAIGLAIFLLIRKKKGGS